APQRAADSDPVDAARRHRLRRLAPQVLVDPALDDPEYGLARRPLGLVPLEAAVEPAVGALGRARRVGAVGGERRALVEGERDVGSERGLDLHRALGAEEVLAAVAHRAEADPILCDLDVGPTRLPPPRLDLVGDATVGEREDLEAARVGDDRPIPAHE